MAIDIVFFFTSIILGYAFSDYVIVKKAKRWHSLGKTKKYHIHHSTYGLMSFLATPITYGSIMGTIFFFGLGVGIIIEHTYHERFVFIERSR